MHSATFLLCGKHEKLELAACQHHYLSSDVAQLISTVHNVVDLISSSGQLLTES